MEKAEQAGFVQSSPDAVEREQRFLFRCKGKILRLSAKQKGFLAEPVAGAEQVAFPRVEDGEGEHAVELREAVFTPLEIGGQQNFRVAVRSENDAFRLQPLGNFQVVVYFAVEGDDGVAADIAHRLGAGWRRIDDGEPSMTEGNRSTGIEP